MHKTELNWPTLFLNSYLPPWFVLAVFQEGVKRNSFQEAEGRESEWLPFCFSHVPSNSVKSVMYFLHVESIQNAEWKGWSFCSSFERGRVK